MLSEQQLYSARRALALELSLILGECDVGNDVMWPELPSSEMAAETLELPTSNTNSQTVIQALSGDLRGVYDVALCRADGYDIMPISGVS